SHYTTRPPDEGEKTGGEVHVVARNGRSVHASLIGPPHPLRPDAGPLEAPFTVTLQGKDHALLSIGDTRHELPQGEYTDCVPVLLRAVPGLSVHGVCKFLLLGTEPDFDLYATPVNIDPEKPAMPVGYPAVYSVYLAKRQGPFATLGLAEDTWGLNEHVLDDEHFLRQCLDTDQEREAIFFDGLHNLPPG